MIREDKEKAVAELHKVFTEAKGIYLSDFTGVTVELVNELRRQLSKENVHYRVIKNTLALRSIQGLPIQHLESYLTGPTGIAYSFDDPFLPGKALKAFQKKTDLMPLKAAVVEGMVYDSAAAEKVLSLPSKEELIVKLLGTLNVPISGLVHVLYEILRNCVCVLDAIREKKQHEGGIQPLSAEAPAAAQDVSVPPPNADSSESESPQESGSLS